MILSSTKGLHRHKPVKFVTFSRLSSLLPLPVLLPTNHIRDLTLEETYSGSRIPTETPVSQTDWILGTK